MCHQGAAMTQWLDLEHRTRDRKGCEHSPLLQRQLVVPTVISISVPTVISISVPHPCYHTGT